MPRVNIQVQDRELFEELADDRWENLLDKHAIGFESRDSGEGRNGGIRRLGGSEALDRKRAERRKQSRRRR